MKFTILGFGLFVFLGLFSCNEREQNIAPSPSSFPTKEIKQVDRPYSNPCLLYGSSFPCYMQQLWKLGNYKAMLNFTSSESIKKHGRERLLKAYKELQFGFAIKLKNKIENPDRTISLRCSGLKFATQHYFTMNVKIENDSTKLLIEDLQHIFK